VGCHPLREVPLPEKEGVESRPLGRLVRRTGGPRESLLHHYATSAIRAHMYTLSTSGRRGAPRARIWREHARTAERRLVCA
jgi:hypothetical protein